MVDGILLNPNNPKFLLSTQFLLLLICLLK